MKKKKFLVIGGSGLLGMKLIEIIENNECEVYATFFQNPIKKKNCFQLDITQKKDVNYVINKASPDIIFHTAAYKNVDNCEKNQNVAFDVNVKGTKNLASIAEKLGTKFVYISTDYVFDGKKGLYGENDTINPINYYGRTKLEGENVVKKICSDFIIARTSVIYGASKNNFAMWIINNLENNQKIKIVGDQYTSPTLNFDLVEQLISLVYNDANGVFHTAGGERIDRYKFSIELADIFDLNKNLIYKADSKNLNWIAKRPRDSSLNTLKISKFKKPYKVKDALEILKKDMGG